jgi:hypothetical protein
MDTICLIETQYYENYGDAQSQHWKKKGGHKFTLMVDSDDFLYEEDVCISTLKEMLESQSNSHEKFEYISHELIFSTPTKLDAEEFATIFSKKAKEKYS